MNSVRAYNCLAGDLMKNKSPNVDKLDDFNNTTILTMLNRIVITRHVQV